MALSNIRISTGKGLLIAFLVVFVVIPGCVAVLMEIDLEPSVSQEKTCGEIEVEIHDCYLRFAKTAHDKFGGVGSANYEKQANVYCSRYLKASEERCE